MLNTIRKWMAERVRDDRGFTLVELLMVMVIIGVLAGLGFTGYNALQKRAAKAQADVYWRDLNTAAQMYSMENGRYPSDIAELLGNYLDDAAEPWASLGQNNVKYAIGTNFVCVQVAGEVAGPDACKNAAWQPSQSTT